MFRSKITKTIFIEGMSCVHCVKRVEEALKAVNGVKAVNVSLEEKNAEIVLKDNVSNEALKEAIEAVGFQVIG